MSRDTVAAFMRRAVARSERYRDQLGDDIAGAVSHHAGRMEHHYRKHAEALRLLQEAATACGIELDPHGPRST
jgi:hypothetical protein